jgi:hypothetical protein
VGIINNVIINSFLLLVSAALLAMENKSGASQPIEIKQTQQSYSSYVSNSFAGGLTCLASSVGSLTNTVVNALSDDAAFQKLGWPPENLIAKDELKRSQDIYKRHNESYKNYKAYIEYDDDCAFINRRTDYCQRALSALYNDTIINRADRIKLAMHCLKHHSQVLNSFDTNKFVDIVKNEQEKIKGYTITTDQELKILLENLRIDKNGK